MKIQGASLLLLGALLSGQTRAELYVSIIQGLGGNEQYEEQFNEQRGKISTAAETLTAADRIMTFHGEAATREALLSHFEALKDSMTDEDRAAIYLIGHGSFDGFDYKFNLPGPDITGEDLKQLLGSLPGRNHFLLNTSSTSGAMLAAITGDEESEETGGNILISATRNGNERNATHFGRFFADALTSEEADINKNNSISVQEAFDYAARNVESYFEGESKLATEHPQIRGEGTAAFSLSRLTGQQQVAAGGNPELDALLEQRLTVDAEIEELQLRREDYTQAEYNRRFQALILEAAQLTERIEAMQQGDSGGGN